ncbi:unnamed protein product [Closterium sp. Naga37s-1]|nr:unnamed protein product [Closterium sp. Naga37s-1]
MICETILKSPLGERPLAQEAADVAREPILFNRRILPNGKTPLGGQKSAARLKDWNLGKLRCTGADGAPAFKSLEQLKTELREIEPARLALKALEAVPEDWKKAPVATGGDSSAASQQQPLPIQQASEVGEQVGQEYRLEENHCHQGLAGDSQPST